MNVYCIVDKTIVLDTPTPKTYLAAPLVYDNTKAHAMRVTVKNKNGTDADLTGIGVTATMKLEGNNTTVTGMTGTVSGNVVQVILPAACYAVPGYYTFNMVFTKSGGYNRTALWVEGKVEKNTSGTPIDPGTPVTNYSTIIANANAAATAANAAAQQVPDVKNAIAPTFEDLMSDFVPLGAYEQHCWYNGQLYVNKVDINASESWVSSHWKAVDVSGELYRIQQSAYGITPETNGLVITL